jgi:AcrR family transcriptional regulator
MRERIVAAAARVIRERGVTGATTKEIARAAKVSEGSLYNHFESKTALFGAAFGSVTSGIRDAMGELAGSVGQGTVEGNLERLAGASIRFYRELLPMAGPALADHEVTSWLRRGMPARGAGPIMGQLALVGYLEAERDAGRLAPGAEPAFMAAALLGACLQHAFMSILTEPAAMANAGVPADADEYARGIVRTVLTRQLPLGRSPVTGT